MHVVERFGARLARVTSLSLFFTISQGQNATEQGGERLLMPKIWSPSITASQPGEGDATVTVSFASSVARELEFHVACYDGFTAGADLTGLSELFMGYADIVLGVDSSDGFEALLEDLQAEAWELWDSGETTPDTCGEVSADALEPLSSTSGILQKGYTKQSVEVGGMFCQQQVSCFVTVDAAFSQTCQWAGSSTIPAYTIIPDQGSWAPVGGAGFSSDEASSTQLAVSRAGVLYAAYASGIDGPATVSMYTESTGWEALGPGGGAVSDDQAAFVRIAVDPAGTVYVAYQDVTAGQVPRVRRYDTITASWEAVGSDIVASGVSDLSLATDSQGIVYLAFSESQGANPGGLTVMKFTNHGGWEPVGAQQFSAGQVFYTSLAVDIHGRPYVSYTDSSSADRVSVQMFDGGEWKFVGSNGHGISDQAAWFTSLSITHDGIPYVAWSALGDGNHLSVAVLSENDTWDNAGENAAIVAPTAYFVTMATDSNGTPFVSYASAIPSGQINAVMLEGNTWVSFDSIAGDGSGTSLALNDCDVPYVIFRDGSAAQRATVSRFTVD